MPHSDTTSTLHLRVMTPDQEHFSGAVQKASFPGGDGWLQVLPHHAPLLSTLRKGTIHYTMEGKNHTLDVEGGLLEVCNNTATVMTMHTPAESAH